MKIDIDNITSITYNIYFDSSKDRDLLGNINSSLLNLIFRDILNIGDLEFDKPYLSSQYFKYNNFTLDFKSYYFSIEYRVKGISNIDNIDNEIRRVILKLLSIIKSKPIKITISYNFFSSMRNSSQFLIDNLIINPDEKIEDVRQVVVYKINDYIKLNLTIGSAEGIYFLSNFEINVREEINNFFEKDVNANLVLEFIQKFFKIPYKIWDSIYGN